MLQAITSHDIILARGPWSSGDITTTHSDPSNSPTEVIKAAISQREPSLIADAERSDGHLFDGGIYGLRGFDVRCRPGMPPELSLDCTHSNYFYELCIDRGLEDPLEWQGQTTTLHQELFGSSQGAPLCSPYLANLFGFGALIITSDGYAIITRRGLDTAVYPGHYTSSVDEGSAFPEDSDDRGGVDLLSMVSRGVMEELALDVRDQDVTFLALGMDPQINNYFLLATITTPLTKTQMQVHLEQHAAVDSWERSALYFVPWELESITQFMDTHTPWVSVTVLEAMRHSFNWIGEHDRERVLKPE